MNGYIGNENRERNERRTDMEDTNSHMGLQLPPLWQEGPCSFQNSPRNYYPAAWEFATAREPKHYNLPFRKFLRLSKPRSWTGDPEHVKYRSILLGPLAHAGIMELCLDPCWKIHELTYWNVLKPFLQCILYCTHFLHLIKKLVLEHVCHGQLDHLHKI